MATATRPLSTVFARILSASVSLRMNLAYPQERRATRKAVVMATVVGFVKSIMYYKAHIYLLKRTRHVSHHLNSKSSKNMGLGA